jgi:hypothetical protein
VGLQDIAGYARNFVWGLDWDKVRQQSGKDLPPEQLVMDSEGWYAYTSQLIIAQERAQRIRDQLALPWEVPIDQVAVAKIALEDGLTSREDVFWTAVNANWTFLSSDKAIAFDTEKYRILIGEMWLNALTITFGHLDGYFQFSGVATPEEIVDSADKVHAFFEGMQYLWEKGYLDPLKAANATMPPDAVALSGLGAGPLAPSVRKLIGWTLLGAIAIIGLYIMLYAVFSRYADMVNECWERADREADTERKQRLWELCQEQQLNLQEHGPDPLGTKAAVNTLAIIAGVGLLAYGAVMLMPQMARSMRKTRREAR